MPPASPFPALASGNPSAPRVCAVLVAYRTDVDLLDTVLAALIPQVGGLVIIDHGNQTAEFAQRMVRARMQGATILCYPDNPGLAAGFNRGIEHARRHEFEQVLLLDQDSVIATDMVSILLAQHQRLSAQTPVAVVGPQFIDPRTGIKAPFVRFGFPFNHKMKGAAGQVVTCDFLISSGSLIPLTVLQHIGHMDETMFIDNIDLDWCMRARAQGYALYGVCDAKMQHTIGETVRRRWWDNRRFVHAPSRLYYSTRNRVLLYRRSYVPWVWIAQDIPRLIGKFAFMCLLTPPRRIHTRAMLHGIRDGLRRWRSPTPSK